MRLDIMTFKRIYFTKWLFTAAVFCIISGSLFAKSVYKEIFGSDYQTALLFIEENGPQVAQQLKGYGADPDILVPVIFPELIRYSLIQDEMETTGLKIFYVNYGEDYADFSIGYFQMKPSFAENIESYFIKHPRKECTTLRQYSKSEKNLQKSIRRQRVRRLENPSWQTYYLACFYHIVQDKFSNKLASFNTVKKIAFFAAAYNAGFQADFKTILAFRNKRFFPNGAMGFSEQYNYSDIAVDYYENYIR
ncbi:MAG: hypothetical protein ABUK01_01805 [Leptospirales bacterium]